MSITSGATFAGYTVLRRLDRDESGDTYLAQHPRLPEWNALRVLPESLHEDQEFRDRFLRETPIATNLHHPHILAVEYRGESEGRLWMVTEHVNGTDAQQLVGSSFAGGMPAGEVIAVVTAIADALDYAHGRGMVHRSVKPASILFVTLEGGEQQILLTDLGIARQVGDPDGAASSDLTANSVAYTAPEQLMGSAVDGMADQYALAATAYFLLTGAPPFQQSNPVAVISQHLTAAPPSLRDHRPELARLDGAFAIALAKNPRDRFASCRAFADALSYGAGAWTGNRSPEAYLTVVDYPDGAAAVPPAYAGEASAISSSPFSSWERIVQRLADHHAGADKPAGGDVGSPATAASAQRGSRWPWVVAIGSVAAALCLGLVAGGVIIGRGSETKPRELGAMPAPVHPAPKVAPPNRNFPGPEEVLDGSYRIDVNREQQVYNGSPDSQPPNVITHWAFRTSCNPKSCIATGIMLDDAGRKPSTGTDGVQTVALDFRNGVWESRPQASRFACLNSAGSAAQENTTQVLTLKRMEGALSGAMTVTVDSNECDQLGAKIEIPTAAARTADVPDGVEVPGPPSGAPPAASSKLGPGR